MKFTISTILFFFATFTLMAQSNSTVRWSYKKYPNLQYKLNHLELELTVNPADAQIKGVGTYHITSQRAEFHQLFFHTSDLEIQTVSADETELEYHISNDSLIIHLPDSIKIGEEFSFQITWQSDSKYGIFKDAFGNIRTSLNPKKIRHWLPVYDHPRIEAGIDASVTIPADQTVIFNGVEVRDEILTTNEKKVVWSSNKPIPVTGLTLAAGSFTKSEALAGFKEIAVYADEDLLLPEVRKGLLEIAVSTVKKLERRLSFEFPFESLQVVVLPDHQWDEIQNGAGVIYLYQSLGSLSVQLRRGIAAQWFGRYHRYVDDIENSVNYEFLKAAALDENELADLKNPDSLHSIKAWNVWANQYESYENEFLKETIEQSLPELVKAKRGVMLWNDYSEFWYEKSGFYLDEFDIPRQDSVQSQESVIIYEVIYNYDELNSSLSLEFTAKNDRGIPALADIQLKAFGFSDTTETTISITGLQDVVEVDIPSGIEFVTLHPKSGSNIQLIEQKPFLFLIKQLRSPNPEDRLNAAAGLQSFRDNPDIQLALIDAMNSEKEPKVKAAILETIGMVFNGATGTEQTFLDALRSANETVKKAAIQALEYYPNNENVINALRNFILRSETDFLFATALQSYQKITGEEELLSLAQRLKELNSSGEKRLAILTAAATDTSIQILAEIEELTGEPFPYSIRKEAIEALIKYQKDANFWSELLPDLLSSRDPRIRFLALDGLRFLEGETASQMLSNLQKEEFDPRIQGKIGSMIN